MQTTENLKYNNTENGSCCWNGCESEGKFPAPKSSENRKERYYFCLQHIREYNNSWDFFHKMDMQQIDSFQKENLTGHRPTWKFGVNNINFKTIEEIRNQVFNDFRTTQNYHNESNQHNEAALRISKQTRDALKILSLSYPVTLLEIKKRYKKLAKENHPDINGNANDDKIKRINQAYSYLKGLDVFKD